MVNLPSPMYTRNLHKDLFEDKEHSRKGQMKALKRKIPLADDVIRHVGWKWVPCAGATKISTGTCQGSLWVILGQRGGAILSLHVVT